jgi:hypothetical protein
MCGSACAQVLFVSGKYRTVQPGGQLAIHSCYDQPTGRAVEMCNELIAAHAEQEGVSGSAMLAFQNAAGAHAAVVFDAAGAACFGLTRAPGQRAVSGKGHCVSANIAGATRPKVAHR